MKLRLRNLRRLATLRSGIGIGLGCAVIAISISVGRAATSHSPSPTPRGTVAPHPTPTLTATPLPTHSPAVSGGPTPTATPTLMPTHSPTPTHAPNALNALDYGTVLARYRTARNSYHTPTTLTFICAIDQAGDRGLSQTHLVYRGGLMVRDETTALGSMSIKPHIHIYRSRAHHYSIETVAPRAINYRFKYLGVREEGARLIYRFATTPLNPSSDFAVTDVEIDGTRFLPTLITFRSHAGNIQATGRLRYGPVEDAWVILEAVASSYGAKGALREHLLFSEYHFPHSLPSSTFGSASSP